MTLSYTQRNNDPRAAQADSLEADNNQQMSLGSQCHLRNFLARSERIRIVKPLSSHCLMDANISHVLVMSREHGFRARPRT